MSPVLKPSPAVVLTRRTIVVAVATFLLAVALGVAGWLTASSTAHEADSNATKGLALAVKVQNRIIAENTAANRANAVVAHAQCLRGNDGRILIRQSEVDVVTIIFNTLTDGAGISPDLAARIARAEALSESRASSLLKLVDCDKFAPMPPHPTRAEIASLPKPTPIPPLTP